jgi:restriction system protein
MAMPTYEDCMLPILKISAQNHEISIHEIYDQIVIDLKISVDLQDEMLQSGNKSVLRDRISWANTYLKKALLLESPKRGVVKITERGRKVLSENPNKIDSHFLMKFQEFVDFKVGKRGHELALARTELGSVEIEPLEEKTPQEILDQNYQKIKKELAADVLSWVKRCSPQFFEKLVVDVLVKMGYGGTRREAGRAVGRSGDGGIDGIIKEDRLGLDVIYLQAKRWEDPVGRPEIQKFVGALHGFRAKKGVFITTSRFSKEAEQYAANIDFKIILVDGEQLADFMVEYNVGVSSVFVYEIKKIDSDYFSEDL